MASERDSEAKVAEFEAATGFDAPMSVRLALLDEEIAEWNMAMADLLKEAADIMYIGFGIHNAGGVECFRLPQATEVIRIMDVMTRIGADMDEAFDRVHASNMSKLVDGKALKREDGKILKGPKYLPPTLSDLAKEI